MKKNTNIPLLQGLHRRLSLHRCLSLHAVSAIACILPAAILVLALAACTRDDDPAAPADDNPAADTRAIRFTATVGHFTGADPATFTGADPAAAPDTRAVIADDGTGNFTAGDEIAIRVNSQVGLTVTTSATYDAGAWTSDLTWDKLGNADTQFNAFFPKLSESQLAPNLFDVPADQSTPDAYASADLLRAKTTQLVAPGTDVPLPFRHLMHRLVVNLSLSPHPGTLTQADVAAATVRIKDMKMRMQVDFDGNTGIADTPLSDITPRKSAASSAAADPTNPTAPAAPASTFYALIPPQTAPTAGTPWIEVRVGNTIVTYPVPAGITGTLASGQQTTLNLRLGNTPPDAVTTYAKLQTLLLSASSNPAAPTKILLGADIDCPPNLGAPSSLEISNDIYVEIDGNGYRLTRQTTDAPIIKLNSRSSLKLTNITMDGEGASKASYNPLIYVSNLAPNYDTPATLTLGAGFRLTGAALPANPSQDDKWTACPGIKVNGILIMEEGSQVTGNGPGSPVLINGDAKAVLRLNGGTFSNNTDPDINLVAGGTEPDYEPGTTSDIVAPSVTIGKPLPAGSRYGLLLRRYMRYNFESFPGCKTVITGENGYVLTGELPKFEIKGATFIMRVSLNEEDATDSDYELQMNDFDNTKIEVSGLW